MALDKVTSKRSTARSMVRRTINPVRSWLLRNLQKTATDSHFLLGRMASWQVRSREIISSLADIEFKVTSQWGEDGIIDWLIERAEIPVGLQQFVEFGVDNYREANTRFLLQNRNWHGVILDGCGDVLEAVIEDDLYWKHQLRTRQAFITRENINELIASSGISGDIGLLSIDLDGNDYWVWEAIDVVKPIICIVEYNAVFGDLHPISVPYRRDFFRTDAHYSNLYFGTSIAALRSLAKRKGYRFVGTTSAANDAFFVREDYASRFVDRCLQNVRAYPSTARESLDKNGVLNYVSGLDRLELIKSMPVVNTESGATVQIGDLENIYSEEWLAAIRRTRFIS